MPPPAGLEDFPDPAESGPRSGWVLKSSAFPPPVKDRGPKGSIRSSTMQARARRGRGGRWPGALGLRLAKGQRGAVAGAMAPAMAAGLAVRIQIVRAQSGREQEAHRVSPARAGRFPADRQVQAHGRPAPAGSGRALAGGFGPWGAAGTGSTGPGRRPRPERAGHSRMARASAADGACKHSPFGGQAVRPLQSVSPRVPPPARRWWRSGKWHGRCPGARPCG